MTDNLYEALGGEPKLREIIDDFVERVFVDIMIGFFFANADKERIKRFEFEHASALLGGPHAYAGRPLRQAHAAHPIRGGHFARRMQILRQVLAAHGVPEPVQKRWLEHDLALAGQITGDALGECND
ncbi:MAG TPA: group 1 truncated hemoglobin [Polyangiales bacterium]|nr:group 1 truncated hemoglobin [Polyangiales bacterium]